MPLLPCFNQVVLDPLRTNDNVGRLLRELGEEFDRHLLRDVLCQATVRCESILMARYYAYSYMLMHHDALLRVCDLERNRLESSVFAHNGNSLIVDFGCGPLTAGLALGS